MALLSPYSEIAKLKLEIKLVTNRDEDIKNSNFISSAVTLVAKNINPFQATV